MTRDQQKAMHVKLLEFNNAHTKFGLKIEKETGDDPHYLVKQANNPHGGMAYFREKSLKDAKESLIFLEKKWSNN